MKILLSATAIIVASLMIGSASAYSPFELSGDNFTVMSYQLDPEVNSVIFEVKSHQPGKIEFTFDREFFDSTSLGEDSEFFGIVDGERLVFKEINTTTNSRTIQGTITQGIHEIEIFGSHLLGKTVYDKILESQIKQEHLQLQTEKEILSNQIKELSTELSSVKTQNVMLETSNKQLEKKIFDPDNLISETEVQASNLISETEVQASNLISETEVQASNLISETEVQASNLISETEVQASNLISETEVQASNLISETEVQASNLISETEVQASNLISETEVQASNLISETEVQASNLISETEVQASNLISETEIQTKKTKGLFQEQFAAFSSWWDSLFPILK